MNEGTISSKYKTLAGMSTALSQSNAGGEETVKWNQNAASLAFANMRTNNFNHFLNEEYSVHRNDDELLADFTALLQDGDDDAFNQIDTQELRAAIGNSESAIVKMEPQDRRLSSGSNRSAGTEAEQLLQTIGSIMSDHDYLSRENTLQIMKNDEECFFQQGNVRSKASTEVDSLTVNVSDAATVDSYSERGSQSNASHELASFLEKMKRKINSNEGFNELLRKFVDKAREMTNDLEKSDVTSSSVPQAVNRNNSSEASGEFSPNHSEPLEYFGVNYATSEGSGKSKNSAQNRPKVTIFPFTEDEFGENMKKDLESATELSEYVQMGIRACKRDIHNFSRLPTDDRRRQIEDTLSSFGEHLESIAGDMIKTAQKFKAYKKAEEPAVNLEAVAKDKEPSASAEVSKDKASNEPVGALTDMNQKSKERWLASSSDEDLSSEEDLSHEANGLAATKKKNANDPSLSQISGWHDDEDNILIKNEPLISESQLSKEKELPKWNDLGGRVDEEDDFHGFDDSEEFQLNDEIDIHVKTEMSSERYKDQSMEISEPTIEPPQIPPNSADRADSAVIPGENTPTETAEKAASPTAKEPEATAAIEQAKDSENDEEDPVNNLSQLVPLENGVHSASDDEEDRSVAGGTDNNDDEDDREIAR